ncbi:hypothetical protein TWF788_005994 [Orbilia oligospora]|uniref:Calcineurin-like phosphoesterase domain-containing protein n=1 Tax=Orbilia oligospora TaxID=2813651 RepID=A0A6G1M039_ORBOL|nr:hypothetical protein TWF788_005994 [Orbilia oligospora]KAF3196321.1 hypothetical protein TWF679_005361 [Orbilia oligospora]KAF3204807.1 hypothetical protein TWF191_002152 [Orbilia oligospora]KAF3240576.1 hypothetical protein TWF192_009472 [Orbilia oligospora]
MARRIVRTATQLAVLSFLAFLLVYLLDTRYRVLPNAIHNRLPTHHDQQIITDIEIASCFKLISGCRKDSPWYRIEKDLYLEEHLVRHAFVHVIRKHEKELVGDEPVVLDIKVSRKQPAAVKDGEVWEQRAGGIWILRGKLRHNAVTAVEVLFGPDAEDPRLDWQIKDTPLRIGKEARLSVRIGSPDSTAEKHKKPKLRIGKSGKFKIIQVADLHLSTGVGDCRDEYPVVKDTKCEADPRTLEYVAKYLDEEKPDLAVLTGDQVNGESSPDAQTALFKMADLFIKRNIPYATIYGNHDDEGDLKRAELMKLTQTLPLSLSEPGPETVPGVGNYAMQIMSHKADHPAVTLYFLDSHSYTPDEKHYPGYDWIKPEQVKWFQDEHESLKPKIKQYSGIHLQMAFIHIPLPEYTHSKNPFVGQWREGVTAPRYNSNFSKALMDAGVGVVTCGHDHANDYCLLERQEGHPKLWMCYGGGAGFGGYGGYNNYIRRIRMFEIDAPSGRITTWKRTEAEDKGRLDEQIIVDSGKVQES